MIIAWENYADVATLTASSELSTLPGSNVQVPLVSKKWETAAAINDAYLVFDTGVTGAPASVVAVIGSNLTSISTIRIRASDSDPTGAAGEIYDSGLVSAGVKDGYGASYKTFGEKTARYWRIDLADASLDSIKVGRVFIGPHWEPEYRMFDWSVTPVDPSERIKGWAGQVYVDRLPKYRVLSFVLDFLDRDAMYGNAFRLARDNGMADDVLVIPNIDDPYVSEQSVWGLCASSEPIINTMHEVYRQKFTVEERL